MTINDKVSRQSNLKRISLVILVIQNSMLVLMMRYSRTSSDYITSTAVFMVEVIKILICCLMIYREKSFQFNFKDLIKMCIPSLLYAIQNNLLYIALSYLEAATFQVTYQLKILSTALFSVWLLDRSLNRMKWLSLIFLMAGVTCVQLENVNTSTDVNQKAWIGLMAVLASCISSGYAGCYFEKLIKTSTTTMWVRNLQMALCSVVFSFGTMMISDYQHIQSVGFFYGYNFLTWTIILNQALGGFLVAFVVKYADNILKGFATSISIIFSSMVSFYLLEFRPSFLFVIGTTIVVFSTVLYNVNIDNNNKKKNK